MATAAAARSLSAITFVFALFPVEAARIRARAALSQQEETIEESKSNESIQGTFDACSCAECTTDSCGETFKWKYEGMFDSLWGGIAKCEQQCAASGFAQFCHSGEVARFPGSYSSGCKPVAETSSLSQVEETIEESKTDESIQGTFDACSCAECTTDSCGDTFKWKYEGMFDSLWGGIAKCEQQCAASGFAQFCHSGEVARFPGSYSSGCKPVTETSSLSQLEETIEESKSDESIQGTFDACSCAECTTDSCGETFKWKYEGMFDSLWGGIAKCEQQCAASGFAQFCHSGEVARFPGSYSSGCKPVTQTTTEASSSLSQ